MFQNFAFLLLTWTDTSSFFLSRARLLENLFLFCRSTWSGPLKKSSIICRPGPLEKSSLIYQPGPRVGPGTGFRPGLGSCRLLFHVLFMLINVYNLCEVHDMSFLFISPNCMSSTICVSFSFNVILTASLLSDL